MAAQLPPSPPLTLFTTTPPVHPPTASYTGYKKSAVFSQWQRQLQLQQYEPACHWTAEADASGWHDDLWAKLVVFASKHVHVHAPTLPTLLARNFAYYRHYLHAHNVAPTTASAGAQPRNRVELRQHLCQAVGLVALSAKGPVYTLPKVDTARVDESKLVVGVHAWLLPHRTSGDTEAVVRLLSTVLWNLEQQDTPNVMYWLSVLLAYEKRQRAAKQPVTMAARQPLPPTDATRAVAVEGKAAQDWAWLLWLALDTACVHYQRPAACRRALRDLAYLFAHDYKTGRRTTRMPLVLHAMHLVRTDTLDWTRSVYPNDAAKALIVKACTNIEVMYAEVQRRREAVLAAAAKAREDAMAAGGAAAVGGSAVEHASGTASAGGGAVAVVATSSNNGANNARADDKGNKKKGKGGMSDDSKAKMDVMDSIDAHLFLF